jgi:CheY-like chemotaxis protein
VSGAEKLRVLIADNDQAVLDLLLLDLRLEGHEVVAAALNGEDALELCEKHQPDVVVVDFRLGPGINGVEVARRLHGTSARVVMFTNYITPDVIADATAAGAVVIEKGNLNALRRAITG